MTDAKDKAVDLLKDFLFRAGVPFGPEMRKRLDATVEALIEASVERLEGRARQDRVEAREMRQRAIDIGGGKGF